MTTKSLLLILIKFVLVTVPSTGVVPLSEDPPI